MILLKAGATPAFFLRCSRRLPDFPDIKWLFPAFGLLTLPFALIFIRFLSPLWVFNFGIDNTSPSNKQLRYNSSGVITKLCQSSLRFFYLGDKIIPILRSSDILSFSTLATSSSVSAICFKMLSPNSVWARSLPLNITLIRTRSLFSRNFLA